MKLGKAYKLAALAAAHKTRAIALLESGDHDSAKKEEIAYLNRIEEIPSTFRQEVSPFIDACLQRKRCAYQ